MPKLRVTATNTGDGVFALSNIKKGTLIRIMSGKRMTSEGVEAAIERGLVCADDPFQIDEDLFIKLDRIPYLFNHSCDPNAGIRHVDELFALRDISKGEQITYDYSTTVCTHSVWQMECRCGAPACRKSIKNIRSVPPKRREYFMQLQALPAFLVKEIKK